MILCPGRISKAKITVFTKFYLPSLKSCRVEIFLFSTVDFWFLLGNREIF